MADGATFRLFIAVTIPEEIKAKIEEAQAELRRALPAHGVRWTRREQFHLTLRFLGDVDAARVEPLGEAIRAVCRGFGPLHLRAERVGFFPDLRYPRVVWVGVQDQARAVAPAARGGGACHAGVYDRSERRAIHRPRDARPDQRHQAAGSERFGQGGGRHGGTALRPLDGVQSRTHAQRALAAGRAAHLPGVDCAGRLTRRFGLTLFAR